MLDEHYTAFIFVYQPQTTYNAKICVYLIHIPNILNQLRILAILGCIVVYKWYRKHLATYHKTLLLALLPDSHVSSLRV